MAKSYENMTLEELEKANQSLMAEKDAIRKEQLEIAGAMDRRAAADRIAKLSQAEKEALLADMGMMARKPPAQTLSDVGGIGPAEKFGEVGGVRRGVVRTAHPALRRGGAKKGKR